jgi:hypothetical protein
MKKSGLPKKKLISKSAFNLKTESSKLPAKKFIYGTFGISLFNIVLVLSLQNFIPPQVPLFYGEAVGENQITTQIGLIIPGLLAFSITIINLILALILESDFLQKVLIFSAFAVSLLSLITTVKIILLVGSF